VHFSTGTGSASSGISRGTELTVWVARNESRVTCFGTTGQTERSRPLKDERGLRGVSIRISRRNQGQPACFRTGAASLTETYQYNDPANRLSAASESGSGCSQTYGYDAFGNRTVGGCTPSTFTPAAESGYNASSNQLTIQGATYDAAGNQVGIGAYAFVYDAENRMISSTNGSTTNYVYDGEGRRVQKVTGTQSTTFVYDAGGQLAAEYSNVNPAAVGTEYLTADHLGSTRLVTNTQTTAAQIVVSCHDYLPFGEEAQAGTGGRSGCYSQSDGVNQKFTGKERDAETASSAMQGLDFFGARYFSGAQGRFTSSDQTFADQRREDPQSWNLYAYVGNNPLRFVDINGKWKTEIHNAIINGAFAGLSNSQRGVLQTASHRVDGFLNGGQTAENAYRHGMRGPFQGKEAARKKADAFISEHESQASSIAKANGRVTDAALDELGTALHTVSDRLSPSHAGEQVWTGAGEPGATALLGPLGVIIGAGIDGARAEIHGGPESTISLDLYHAAIDAERAEYLKAFGQEAFTQATGCKQIVGCAYKDSELHDEDRKKPQ